MNYNDYLKRAFQEHWAIGQFNFSDEITLLAILKAGQELSSPLILAISERSSRIFGLERAVELVRKNQEEIRVPVFLNLDHAKDLSYIKKAIDLGFAGVHFDGSGLALNENIAKTKEIVDYAQKIGTLVEGEVGFIGNIEDKKVILTDPSQAQQFIKETKIKSLAIAIGNLHGGQSSGQNPNLNLERLIEIGKKTYSIPLVLHGGSGVGDQDVKEAIKLGIAKVNINTELKVAYASALEKKLSRDEIIQSIQKVVEQKIKLFGSENKAK